MTAMLNKTCPPVQGQTIGHFNCSALFRFVPPKNFLSSPNRFIASHPVRFLCYLPLILYTPSCLCASFRFSPSRAYASPPPSPKSIPKTSPVFPPSTPPKRQ